MQISLKKYGFGFFIVMILLLAFTYQQSPTLYVIGDSTVRNYNKEQWGWGTLISNYFDSNKISISNQAMAGRSTRTFIKEKRWERVLSTMKKGDYVMMQFGHNDGSPLDDTARARGTIRGIGDESKEINNPITKQLEVVHTYGWYLRKFINDIKSKGGIAIVCSPIPRNDWKDRKVRRANAV